MDPPEPSRHSDPPGPSGTPPDLDWADEGSEIIPFQKMGNLCVRCSVDSGQISIKDIGAMVFEENSILEEEESTCTQEDRGDMRTAEVKTND